MPPLFADIQPAWDGGDSVKCGGWNTGLKICNGGNPKAPLPQSCNPPHSFPVGWNPKPAPSPPATTPPKCTWVTKCTPATCNWSQWWTCINPSSWSQKCTSTCVAPTPGTPSASSAAAGPSIAASSAAAAPSDAAPSDPASTVSSAAPAATSAAPVDPIQYPVCNQKYQVTYTNFTLIPTDGYWVGKRVGAATQDDSYMTYTLADSPESCLTACDNIEGCVFVNSYIDRNDDEAYLPKHTPGVYTCSMYSKCVGTEKNNNWGGQDDPNDIVNSSGYCKSGACGV